MSTSITTEKCQLCDFTVTSNQSAVDSSMIHHFCTEHTFKDSDKYEKYMRIRHLIKRHPQEPNH
mgnify:CR=1